MSFGGAHQLQKGDRIKWVPLGQGNCDGFNSNDYGGTLGKARDGWAGAGSGESIVEVRLSAGEGPYALCTMEVSKGARTWTRQPHVIATVAIAPSPPPSPPHSPPPFSVLQLVPRPDYDELARTYAAQIKFWGGLALIIGSMICCYVCFVAWTVCKHVSLGPAFEAGYNQFNKLEEEEEEEAGASTALTPFEAKLDEVADSPAKAAPDAAMSA